MMKKKIHHYKTTELQYMKKKKNKQIMRKIHVLNTLYFNLQV